MAGRHTALLTLLLFATSVFAEADGPLDKAESRFAKHGEVRVHYKSLGKGSEALVFVHGWTCDLTFWRAQATAFKDTPRMVFLDLPGHGKSDKPKVEYTMALFARSIDAVLKDAGVSKAVLVGHSMGTPVVREFYRLFPDKTAGLVAADGSLRPFTAKPQDLEAFLERLGGADSEKVRGRMVDGMFGKDATDDLRKGVKTAMLKTPQHVAVGAMKGMIDPAIWKEDPIKTPLLVVVTSAPQWEGYEKHVRKLSSGADYRVIEGVGHFLMMEKPDEFNKAVASFLREKKLLRKAE
jgi:pimeloyl-ACP methyl ester carboxylesterase